MVVAVNFRFSLHRHYLVILPGLPLNRTVTHTQKFPSVRRGSHGQVRIARPFELLGPQRSVIKPGTELDCGKSSVSVCRKGGLTSMHA